MQMPVWSTYCEGTKAVNALVFELGDITIWFSYKTPVAFRLEDGPIIVRVNEWNVTTGKHLNSIDGGDKKSRVIGDIFERELKSLLEGML